jgi:hypothetical protein
MSPRVPAPVRRLAFALVATMVLFVSMGLPTSFAAGSGTEADSGSTSSAAGQVGIESVTAQSKAKKPKDDAKPVSTPGPFVVHTNSAFNFDVAFKNKGNTTWTAADGYAFQNVTTGSITTLTGCDGLPPGATCTFHRTVNVGSSTGKFSFVYQMIHNGKGFGKTVKVKFKAVD